MTRSIRFLPIAILSWVALAAMPGRADTPLSTSRFSLIFPDGWKIIPDILRTDSGQTVGNTQSGSLCILRVLTAPHPYGSREIDSLRQLFSADTAVITTMESKTLGGKSYAIVEIRNKDTVGNFSTIRDYYFASGTTLFTASFAFHPDRITTDIAELESALATLSLSATPIRVVAARARPSEPPADQDILGRIRPFAARTALFRLPSR